MVGALSRLTEIFGLFLNDPGIESILLTNDRSRAIIRPYGEKKKLLYHLNYGRISLMSFQTTRARSKRVKFPRPNFSRRRGGWERD